MAALVVALPRIIIDLPIFTLIHAPGEVTSDFHLISWIRVNTLIPCSEGIVLCGLHVFEFYQEVCL